MTTLAYLVIILLHLESPKWLLLQGKKKEAIDVLNYVAWFNGVDYRLPKDT